jgi:hypothetical protein
MKADPPPAEPKEQKLQNGGRGHRSSPHLSSRHSLQSISRMSETYRHCGILFVGILIVTFSSSSALSWNARGPIKVEDMYSCENIPGTTSELVLFFESKRAFFVAFDSAADLGKFHLGSFL